MPGLKKGDRSEKTKLQVLGNVLSLIDERAQGDVPVAPELKTASEETAGNREEATASGVTQIYAKTFQTVGSTTRKKYESGKIPLLHRTLFEAIKAALEKEAELRGNVKLAPILDDLDLSRVSSAVILSCLEAYGYLRIEGQPTKLNGYHFEILRDIQEVRR